MTIATAASLRGKGGWDMASTRTMGKRMYYFFRDFAWQKDAINIAATLRRRGYLARVVSIKGGYAVYADKPSRYVAEKAHNPPKGYVFRREIMER